jgi:hypothetical protein
MDDRVTRTRLDPDSAERFVPLRRQLGVSTFGLNQIVLQPGQQGRIHRHLRQEEVYLGGDGEHRGRDGEAFADWTATEPTSPQELPLPADLPAAERRA